MSAAAILLPGAERRLLPGKSQTLLAPRWITVHTMVGTLAGTESWFRPAGRAYSHFGVGGEGQIRQWQDLRFRAASDLDGNPYSISWECEDTGPAFLRWAGSDVPAFTDAQAEALVVGLSWCCHRFNLPATAIATSCPHERGIGWHRLGVDPWRNTTCGQRWSSARGKACPGDRRIHQLRTEIIPAISAPTPAPPAPSEEDDMPPVLAALRAKPGSDAEYHHYVIQGRMATFCPDEEAIAVAHYLGAAWWGGSRDKAKLDPAIWSSLAVMNGPLANLRMAKSS